RQESYSAGGRRSGGAAARESAVRSRGPRGRRRPQSSAGDRHGPRPELRPHSRGRTGERTRKIFCRGIGGNEAGNEKTNAGGNGRYPTGNGRNVGAARAALRAQALQPP